MRASVTVARVIIAPALVSVAGLFSAGALSASALSRPASAQALSPIVVVATVATRTGTFLGLESGPAGSTLLERFSSSNGAALGTDARLPGQPGGFPSAEISGPARASDGALWLTLSTGPRYRGGLASGDPAPNSCSGRVVRIAQTGRTSTVELTSPSSQAIGAAVPSPDGRELAYVEGGCQDYLDSHIVVRDQDTGGFWSIGAGATPCHEVSQPSFSPGGRSLLFTYRPSLLRPGAHPTSWGCLEPGAAELAVVPAGRTSEITASELTKAPTHCAYSDAAFTPTGIVALETCGGLYGFGGATYLVRLNDARHVLGRTTLPPGADGETLSVDRVTGEVLIDEYQTPEYPASAPGGSTYVFGFAAGRLSLIRHYPQLGQLVPSGATA